MQDASAVDDEHGRGRPVGVGCLGQFLAFLSVGLDPLCGSGGVKAFEFGFDELLGVALVIDSGGCVLQCASASGLGVGVGHRLWRRLGCVGKLGEGHLENFARASGAGLRGGEPKLTLCDVGCDSQLIVAQKHKLRSSSRGSFQRWNVAQALRSAVRSSTRESVGPMPVFTEPVWVRWKLEGQCGSVP